MDDINVNINNAGKPTTPSQVGLPKNRTTRSYTLHLALGPTTCLSSYLNNVANYRIYMILSISL